MNSRLHSEQCDCKPLSRIRSELHSAADARGAVADLSRESVAAPMN